MNSNLKKIVAGTVGTGLGIATYVLTPEMGDTLIEAMNITQGPYDAPIKDIGVGLIRYTPTLVGALASVMSFDKLREYVANDHYAKKENTLRINK